MPLCVCYDDLIWFVLFCFVFLLSIKDRKQFILICHDWGSIIGSEFVSKHTHMIQKYVLMGAPARVVFSKLLVSSMDQFKKSWYVLLFQVPILPELMMAADDFADISKVWTNEEVREVYKYVLSRPGANTFYLFSYIFFLIFSLKSILIYKPFLMGFSQVVYRLE